MGNTHFLRIPKNIRNLDESSGTFSLAAVTVVESAEAVEGAVDALGDVTVDETVEAILVLRDVEIPCLDKPATSRTKMFAAATQEAA
jgi:hypothetical protein